MVCVRCSLCVVLCGEVDVDVRRSSRSPADAERSREEKGGVKKEEK